MAALTINVDPEELLGLTALVQMSRAANGGEADATSTAKTLIHGSAGGQAG